MTNIQNAAAASASSWPGLSRPSTSCEPAQSQTWMPGSRPGMTTGESKPHSEHPDMRSPRSWVGVVPRDRITAVQWLATSPWHVRVEPDTEHGVRMAKSTRTTNGDIKTASHAAMPHVVQPYQRSRFNRYDASSPSPAVDRNSASTRLANRSSSGTKPQTRNSLR